MSGVGYRPFKTEKKHHRSPSGFLRHLILPIMMFVFLAVPARTVMAAGCQLDISDTPVDTRLNAAPALIMFVLDDSGSMDWEFMTGEPDGVFNVGGRDHEYVFDDPGDHLYRTGVNSQILSGDDRKLWKSQWSGYNRLYYNPRVEYTPWLDHNGEPIDNADMQNPKSHPYRPYSLDMSDTYVDILGEASGTGSGDVLYVNQRSRRDNKEQNNVCGEWLYLGTYEFAAGRAGSVTIERHSGSNGSSTVADAIGWVLEGTDIYRVVDNSYGYPEYQETSGSWGYSGYYPNYGWDSRWTGSTGGRAVFTPDLPTAGNWEVFAWWNCYANRDEHAKIIIDGGTSEEEEIPGALVSNAHYYTWDDNNGNGEFDSGEDVYLVNFEDDNSDGNLDSRKFYKFVDSDSDDRAESDELNRVSEDSVPISLRERTWDADLQNFANWYTYHRRRWLTTVAAVSYVMPRLEGVKVGIRSINGHLVQPVVPIKIGSEDETETILTQLHELYFDVQQASTPLRRGLEKVGLYFHTDRTTGNLEDELTTSPFATSAGGECQQAFAIVFTDGYWNGGAPLVSNEDGDNGPPYADSVPGTLADVAMYYYENDLAPDVANLVPTNFIDKATHQHMVTYGITFGVNGHLNPEDYDLYNLDPAKRTYPTWPGHPLDNLDKIDDVWHASVNGRGKYFSARDPQELATSFNDMISDVLARIGSGAALSINGEELTAGTTIFQAGYSTENWTGDVVAYAVDPDTGEVLVSDVKWSANEQLDAKAPNDRVIATYNGVSGIPFRFGNLTNEMKAMLSADNTIGAQMVDYLRGNPSQELKNGGIFRDRFLKKEGELIRENNKLADIVHSGPVYHGGLVFVGSNSGMVHAFEESTGEEKFAYVPNLVFQNLARLTDPTYSHKYYVDLTPYVKETDSSTLLVGGLGKGGKGYYCLDITNIPDPLSEATLAANVKWEYPRASTSQSEKDDMGYSFSQAFIVPSNAGWIVIFGNGYNSANGNAVLFVLDAHTGTLLKRIDTGVGPCNGLSTANPVDADNDGVLDYVYAGDLMGNLWKFDFTGNTASSFGIAYSDSGVPTPLFKARSPSGAPQPITNMCDVMFHCKLHGYIVVFGTGKYLGATDFLDNTTQTIYGVWDYGDDADDSEFLGSFDRVNVPHLSNQPDTVSLLEQTEVFYGERFGVNVRVLSRNEAVWATEADPDPEQQENPSSSDANHAGWYFDLPLPKERVVRDIVIRDGKAIVVTVVPELGTACLAGGGSIVHEIDACTGARLEKPQFDANQDGEIDERDMIEIPDPEGGGGTIRVAPSGIKFSSMLYEPVILSDPPVEIKYFGSSSGRIESIRELPAQVGFSSWREVW